MKLSFKQTTKHIVLVIAAAVIAGSGATIGVFAAIPHSTTGVISACRDNTTGAVRVIDAEASESCTGSETALSWDSTDRHSALARFDVDAENSAAIVYNAARSRNIVKADIVNWDESTKYICIEAKFSPETTSMTQGDASGMAMSASISNVRLASQGSMSTAMINYYCAGGTGGYNAFAKYDTTLPTATASSISFAN